MSLFKLPQGEFTRTLGQLSRVFRHIGTFSLVINLLLLAPSLYMLQTYDRVLTSRNEGTLVMLTALLAGLLALEATLEYLRSLVMSRASAAESIPFLKKVVVAGSIPVSAWITTPPPHFVNCLSPLTWGSVILKVNRQRYFVRSPCTRRLIVPVGVGGHGIRCQRYGCGRLHM